MLTVPVSGRGAHRQSRLRTCRAHSGGIGRPALPRVRMPQLLLHPLVNIRLVSPCYDRLKLGYPRQRQPSPDPRGFSIGESDMSCSCSAPTPLPSADEACACFSKLPGCSSLRGYIEGDKERCKIMLRLVCPGWVRLLRILDCPAVYAVVGEWSIQGGLCIRSFLWISSE